MKSIFYLLCSIVILVVSPRSYAQSTDQVINQYIDAIGGRSKVSKIKSMSIERQSEINGIKVTLNETVVIGKGYRSEINLGNLFQVTETYNPKEAFTLNPLSGSKSSQNIPDAKYTAGKEKIFSILGLFLEYKNLGYTGETLGSQKSDGAELVKIRLKSTDGVESLYYFNKKTHLLVKSVTILNSFGLKKELISQYDDYRQIQNIKYPYRLSSNDNIAGLFLTSEIKKIEINQSINAKLFERPADPVAKIMTNQYEPIYKNINPTCQCEDLAQLKLPNTKIIYAKRESSENSCRVTAIINHPPFNDSVTVFLALPQDKWNGRFQGNGGGGFQGGSPESLSKSVIQGFASGSTDGGHSDPTGTFALDKKNNRYDWQAIRNFSHVAIHDMTTLGKIITEKYYGNTPKYSYFVGGSNGGRQAMESVQRYPLDYNGVIAGCPAIYWNHFLLGFLWPTAVMNDVKHYVSKEKLTAVTQAVITAWDEKDGLKDGVIADPFTCTWDPKEFVGTKVGNDIFTDADADVVRQIWDGPKTKRGEFMWYGLTKGSNLTDYAFTSGTPLKAIPNALVDEWVKYFLIADPKFDVSSVNIEEFEKLFVQSVDQYAYLYQTSNSDLNIFKNNGGKLIITHGLTDSMIPPQGSIQYYNKLIASEGSYKKTADFSRLFLYPGLDHGFQGPGAKTDQDEFFRALIKWNEKGSAPDFFEAQMLDNPLLKENLKVKIYPYKGNLTEIIKNYK